VGWTVCLYLADCSPVRRGPSAQFEGDWGGTRGSGAYNGPSAPGHRTVRAPRGLSAGVSQTVHTCRAQVGPRSRGDKPTALSFFFPNRKSPSPHLSLALSQERTPPPLGDFDWGTPRTVQAHPRNLHEILHHVIRVFFAYLTLSLSDFEQEGD
jgi:hypothetical protein